MVLLGKPVTVRQQVGYIDCKRPASPLATFPEPSAQFFLGCIMDCNIGTKISLYSLVI